MDSFELKEPDLRNQAFCKSSYLSTRLQRCLLFFAVLPTLVGRGHNHANHAVQRSTVQSFQNKDFNFPFYGHKLESLASHSPCSSCSFA